MSRQLSVIISSYNQAESIANTVRILHAECAHYKYNAEIIIADDGSDRGSMNQLTSELSKESPGTNLKLAWQEDKGFRLAQARNNGLEIATGEVIIFLDGDCTPGNDFVTEHLQFHQKYDQSVCVGKRDFKPNILPDDPMFLEQQSLCSKAEEMEDYTVDYRSRSSVPWTAVLGRNFSIKQTQPATYFDARMFGWGGEDLAYALSLRKLGVDKVSYNRQAVVFQSGVPMSGDPHVHQEPLKAAYAQINHLLLMQDYRDQEETYIELGRYLNYYATPFVFDGSIYKYDEDKKQEALRTFSSSSIYGLQEAMETYFMARDNILAYSTEEKGILLHPAFAEIRATP